MKTKLSQKNIPKGWNQVMLGEVLSIGSGKDYKHLQTGDVPVFGTGGYMRSVNKPIHSGETVFIGRKGTIDKPFYFEGDFWTVDTLFYTHEFKNTTAKYINYVFQKINWKAYNEASGVPSLSKTTIEKIKILRPPLPEQKRIVAVLETWDKAINQLEKKIALKKQLKKGLMQELLTGKTRLTGFNEEWEETKIGSIGEIVTGSTPPKKDIDNYGNDFCWATAEDLGNKYVYDTVIKLTRKGKANSRFLPAGSILVTCIASIGKNGIAAVPLATNQQINSIIVNKDHFNEFVYYLLSFYRNILEAIAGAGAMKMLSKGEFQKIKFLLPKKKEQLAIANILTTVDKEIQVLERKLKALQEQKRYLLNNLVSGKIRTPENLIIN